MKKEFNWIAYQVFKATGEEIDSELDSLRDELEDKFPVDGIMGMHSDETKRNPEYQKLILKQQIAFKKLQDNNKSAPKEFKRKRSEEYREKKMKNYK